jgi:hypothetical protein
MKSQSAKAKRVLDRIKSIEASLVRGREYLESSQYADWHGFRPLFDVKWRGDRELPPHKDWVRNVFIPRQERALVKAEKVLERLERLDSPTAGSLLDAGGEP